MSKVRLSSLLDSSRMVRAAAGFYFDAARGGISKPEAAKFADTFGDAAQMPPAERDALLTIAGELKRRARGADAKGILDEWQRQITSPRYYESGPKLLEYLSSRRPELVDRLKAAHYMHPKVPLEKITVTKAEPLETVKRRGVTSYLFRVWVKPEGYPDTVLRLLVTPPAARGGKPSFELER